MRKLLWFTLGFGISCGLFLLLDLPQAAPLFLMIPAGAFALLGREWRPGRVIALVLAGISLGSIWCFFYDGAYLAPAKAMDEKTSDATVEVSDYSTRTRYGITAEGRLQLDGKTYLVQLYLNDPEAELHPGDTVTGRFSFAHTGIHAVKSNVYQSARGILLLAYQAGEVKIQPCEKTPLKFFPQVLRARLIAMLEEAFPDDASAFAKALLLGDRTDIDYVTDTSFKASGISHVIAVSGLHVSILFALLYFVTGRRRFLTVLLGIPVVVFFAALAGFSASVTRACIMHILMMVALLFDREYDGPTALSFSGLVMMVMNPVVILSVSFQLSFGCMTGIFLFCRKLQTWLDDGLPAAKTGSFTDRLRRWLINSASVTLSAMSVTTPMVAYYFETVSLIGILTNLLTLWVITFIFYGIMLVCLLGWIWYPGAVAAAWIIAWPIRYVLGVSKLLASFPLAAVYTKSIYIVLWLAAVYLMLAVFLLTRRKRAWVFVACAIVSLCTALLASWMEPLTDQCRVTVLDVGQGQCILLQSEGRTYLVDCGGASGSYAADMAAETLLSQGVSRLDGVVVTHYDEDHTNGLANLLTRVDADLIFVPTTPDKNRVADAVDRASNGTVLYVEKDMVLTFGTAKLTVFGPLAGQSGNESSMCVLFQAADCDILVTGDRSAFGEQMLLRHTDLPKLDVLIAGHHGSNTSTGEALLAETRPEIVMISVGRHNRFGHPHPDVLERLADAGCRVYRTDTMGTLTFRR